MGKVEIIPPSGSQLPARRTDTVLVPSGPPRINPGGLVSSTLTRWEANRHSRAISAITERTRAEANLFDAQTQALESYSKRQRAAARVQELPEIIANDRAIRRAERADELRQARHQYEVSEVRRQTEIAHVDRALTDARQALQAQREHGYDTYALEWKKRKCEILEVELSMAERKAILDEHMGASNRPQNGGGLSPDPSDAEVDEALHEARAQLRASGLDTGRIDVVIARRSTTARA